MFGANVCDRPFGVLVVTADLRQASPVNVGAMEVLAMNDKMMMIRSGRDRPLSARQSEMRVKAKNWMPLVRA